MATKRINTKGLKHQDVDTRQIAERNRIGVLTTASDNGGWLTRSMVDWTIYASTKETASRRTSSNRLLTSMVHDALLLARRLPTPHHELAWVLTRAGARRLTEALHCETPIVAASGWGKIEDHKWVAPKSALHDARAAAFLTWACMHLHRSNQPSGDGRAEWTPAFEPTLQRLNNWKGRKRPDGVLVHHGRHPKAIWVEVEASRKAGTRLDKQIAAMASITAGDTDLITVPIAEYPWRVPMKVATTTMVVLRTGDASDAYKKACISWLKAQKHTPHRILYQLAFDTGGGEFTMGPVVDLRSDGRGNAVQQA